MLVRPVYVGFVDHVWIMYSRYVVCRLWIMYGSCTLDMWCVVQFLLCLLVRPVNALFT